MVLKIHYLLEDHSYTKKSGQKGEIGLRKLIVLAEKRFEFLDRFKLGVLKYAGDEILHRYHRSEPLSRADERTIVEFMVTLKYLIQRAGGRLGPEVAVTD